jgi:hypothetical protein
MESIEIDGALCDGRGKLDVNSHVVGSDFSMSLEELDKCSTSRYSRRRRPDRDRSRK